jgi:sigma-B regulation protein RsbU (phosphoserine phosphatase)
MSNVNRRNPSHLRLHIEDTTLNQAAVHAKFQAMDEVAAVLQAFAQATGWGIRSTANRQWQTEGRDQQSAPPLRLPAGKDTGGIAAPGQSGSKVDGEGTSRMRPRKVETTHPPRWKLVDAAPMDGILSANDLAHFPTVTLEHADHLLAAIEGLVHRLETVEEALRRQEAELATSVSVSRGPNEQQELADRMDGIIASSGKSIGASAAAIYLLDEATSSLKLRACWGLPTTRLAAAARPLRGSLADLEALLGNAVLLEDCEAMPEWPSPEDFASALVVPIGSTSMPHGTLWFWSDQPRKHTTIEIEIANLASGRIMSELEHSLLGNEAKVAKQLRQKLNAAGNAQAARFPSPQALHADYEISGWTFQDEALGGGFHDWDMNPQEMMVVAVGSAASRGPQGALVATAVQSTIRTLWPSGQSPSQIMKNASDVLWGADDADWTASAAIFQLNPGTGYGSVCLAGEVQAFIVGDRGFRPLGSPTSRMALRPDTAYASQRFVLQPGEVLLAFSDNVIQEMTLTDPASRRSRKSQCKALNQNEILQSVRRLVGQSASDIAAHLARLLPSVAPQASGVGDRSLVVIKHAVRGRP